MSKACSAKTTMPVLECIKISAKNDVLTLLAYDGEISIEKKIKADVLEEGEICVNGRFFSDFIGKVAGMNVVIGTGDKGLEIRYEDSESFMQALPAEDFPCLLYTSLSTVISKGSAKTYLPAFFLRFFLFLFRRIQKTAAKIKKNAPIPAYIHRWGSSSDNISITKATAIPKSDTFTNRP